MPLSGIDQTMIFKALSGLVGTILSFALMWPKTWQDTSSRIVVSPISGFFFADSVREMLNLADTVANMWAGGTLAGLFSWVLFGAAWRLIQSITWENVIGLFKRK